MTTDFSQTRHKTKRRRGVGLPLIITLIGLFLVCIPLFMKGIRLYRIYQNFDTHLATVEAIQAQGLSNLKSAQAITLTREVRADTEALLSEIEPFLPIAPYLTWIPRVGVLMPVLPEVVEVADSGTLMAVELAEGLSPALDVLSNNTSDSLLDASPELLDVLYTAKPNINRSIPYYMIFEENLQEILASPERVEALPWAIRSQLPTLETLLPFGENGLRLALVLPEMAARDTQRTYLLVAQNEDELRPTGGFISGAGVIGIQDGQLQGMVVEDAYAVDDFLNKPYDFPPDPLYEFLTIELLLFRDANYWPDFPRSAEKMMDLYTYGRDVPVDGAIAIDQQFLFDLIELVEPIEIPELEITMTAADAEVFIQQAWATGDEEGDWRLTRKSFLGPMAGAILSKLESDIGSVDPIALANMLLENTATKSLQIYMRHPAEAATLNDIAWDGQIQSRPERDFLLALDHNMGTNKVNALISNELEYSVTLFPDGTAEGVATSSYIHNGTDTGEICSPDPVTYTRGLEYIDLINLCYRNYYRLYVPLGSTLLASTNHKIPGNLMVSGNEWSGTSRQFTDSTLGLTVFDNFLLVSRGGEQTIQSVYQLPPIWSRNSEDRGIYELSVIRQAGQDRDIPLTITVTLPPDTEFESASPAPSGLNQSVVQFKTTLNRDRNFKIIFK